MIVAVIAPRLATGGAISPLTRRAFAVSSARHHPLELFCIVARERINFVAQNAGVAVLASRAKGARQEPVRSRLGVSRNQPGAIPCGLRSIKDSISSIKSFMANGFVMYASQPLSRSFSSSIRNAVAITIGIFFV